MSANPVSWFEIYVQDIERAAKFYEAVFDVKLDELPAPVPGISMKTFPMETGAAGAAGAICRREDVPSGGNSTLVYFSCDDCATEASRVAAAGGQLHVEKMPIGEYGFIAIAADTEGNMIGLHSRK